MTALEENVSLYYIDKFIDITLKNNTKISGECFTIDPVTNSVVILAEDHGVQNAFQLQIILLHAIECIKIGIISDSFKTPEYREFKNTFVNVVFGSTDNKNKNYSDGEILERQSRMKDWLELNRLPVSLTSENILSVVNGLALIEPPYNVESCRSTNTIVLDRVMRIVKSCPTLEN
ncbi:gem-associated protein 6-like [Hydractinia symbiolongicarpus]|uniref:gem-associated protein 6-like n=1 Tax=Hydractinia symbiolongicarpus TaxID=13093 RepID=UPI00254BD250|nr:gem-associated protein 6-like [Hydractinia symbiolongicarpus]